MQKFSLSHIAQRRDDPRAHKAEGKGGQEAQVRAPHLGLGDMT